MRARNRRRPAAGWVAGLASLWLCGAPGEAAAQEKSSPTVVVNIKTLPGRPSVDPAGEAIEVVVNNPNPRRMVVDVLYLAVEATDLASDEDDAGPSPWKKIRLTVNPGRLDRTGIVTRYRTVYYFAADEQGWYAGPDDADTPTLTVAGRTMHTIAMNLGDKKGFSLRTRPTLSRDQVAEMLAHDKSDSDAVTQTQAVAVLGAVVERSTFNGRTAFRIEKVFEDGPADRHELNVGDLVLGIDGESFRPGEDLETRLRQAARRGRPFNLTVRTAKGTLPYTFLADGAPGGGPAVDPGPPTLGVVVLDYVDPRGRFRGARIAEISSGSPAEALGLNFDHVIVALSNQPVRSRDEFLRVEQTLRPGVRAPLRYVSLRNDRQFDVAVEFPASPLVAAVFKRVSLGVAVRNNPQGGVVVTDVAPTSPLDGTLQVNFLITELNDQPIRSKADFDRAEAAIKPGRPDVSIKYIDTNTTPFRQYLRRFGVAGP